MAGTFAIGARRVTARITRRDSGLRLELDGRAHTAALRALGPGEYLLEFDGAAKRLWLAVDGDAVHIHLDGRSWCLRPVAEGERAAGASGHSRDDVTVAPMPGTVIAVPVTEGERVRVGQTLLVIESMKMETPINAWRDGTVARIHQALGATFERNAPLVSLAPADPKP